MNINSEAYRRGFNWAKKEFENGMSQEIFDVYLSGPDRNDFDYGAEAYLRTINDGISTETI